MNLFKTKNLSAFLLSLTLSTSAFAQENIIGGTVVTEPALLASVAGVYMEEGMCSGFMLNQNYAVTASHCPVVAGTIVQVMVAGKRENCTVTQMIMAPGANNHFTEADFQILKVRCTNAVIKAASYFELPGQDEEITGAVQAAGYGEGSSGLSSVDLTMASNYEELLNKNVEKSDPDMVKLFENAEKGINACMTLDQVGHTPFYGDSGGPIFAKTSTGYKIVSVVSIGLMKDTHDNAASVYGLCGPKLSHYSDWIKNQIK